MLLIDGLQYCNWSEKIFKELKLGKVTAIHVTITYHENFRETVHNIEKWNRWFEAYPDLIFQASQHKISLLHKKHIEQQSSLVHKTRPVSKTISASSRFYTV